jgi:hypothetical protein
MALLFAAAACSKHSKPQARVDPAQMENFISAQEAALSNAEADEASENAAERRTEVNRADTYAAGSNAVPKAD